MDERGHRPRTRALSGRAGPGTGDFLETLCASPGADRFSVVRRRSELETARGSPWASAQLELVRVALPDGATEESFTLPGICPVENRAVRFLVDLQSSADGTEKLPNYRERMVCPSCGLNSRQRGLALVALRLIAGLPRGAQVLLLECESALFRALSDRCPPHLRLVGSEFLGASARPGEIVGGLRHEDACRLSFGAGTLAAHLSSDVLEHVADPRRALGEAYRCLVPGGVLLFSIPFYDDRDHSRSRAVCDESGGLRHLEPPLFHADPRSEAGSLVVTEFGWDVLDWIRAAGFRDAAILAYWDPGFGFVHPFDTLFIGSR